jgi:hypothetical protein
MRDEHVSSPRVLEVPASKSKSAPAVKRSTHAQARPAESGRPSCNAGRRKRSTCLPATAAGSSSQPATTASDRQPLAPSKQQRLRPQLNNTVRLPEDTPGCCTRRRFLSSQRHHAAAQAIPQLGRDRPMEGRSRFTVRGADVTVRHEAAGARRAATEWRQGRGTSGAQRATSGAGCSLPALQSARAEIPPLP